MQQVAQRAGPTSPGHTAMVVRRVFSGVLAGLSTLVVAWSVLALLDVADTYGNVGHGWGMLAAAAAFFAWVLAIVAAVLWASPPSTRLLVAATVLPLGAVLVAYVVIALVTGTFGAA